MKSTGLFKGVPRKGGPSGWFRLVLGIFGLAGCVFFPIRLSAAPISNEGKPMATYRNPILSGFHPDPSVCRAGDDFYLVNSTFEYFPGLPIYHSRDLTHWEQVGNALDRPSQLPLKGATDFGGLYAPTIRYWKGTFYLTCTNITGGGNFIVTAKDPRGPWSEPHWIPVSDIDGSMLFDDDGKAYFTSQGGGEKAGIKQCEFNPATFKITSESKVIHNDLAESWNEGPHLYKIRGKYYLMVAEGGTGLYHMEWIGRSDNPWGPWEPCPFNPILTERDEPKSPIQCTGHADLIEAPDGTWWMAFLGVRMHDGTSVLGRETFLAPVEWKDGWPVVNGTHHVALEMPAPNLKPHPFPQDPARDDFNETQLGPPWIHVRNIRPDEMSLTRRKGFLSLRAAKDSLDDKTQEPAFAGRRQPDFNVVARCEMEFKPAVDGVEAGLVVRSNDDNHYEIGVGRHDGAVEVFVRNRVKAYSSYVARSPFAGEKVWLELSGQVGQYQFAYSSDGKKWETLAASDASDLSKEKAGGFTGTAIGMFATGNGTDTQTWADFDWFEMAPGKAPDPIALSPRPTPTPIPAQALWRIRCGGTEWTDAEGNHWEADRAYTDSETAGAGRPIAASRDGELYATERWGRDFTYNLPVPPGEYRVRLLFAETYLKKPGERVFDVLVNGHQVLKNLDILKEAGGVDKGIERVFKDVKPDAAGKIAIRFVASVQNAKVCALEVQKKP